MTWRHAVLGGMMILLLVLFVLCSERRTVDPLTDEVLELQRASVAADAELVRSLPLKRDPWRVEASWELVTRLEWKDYRQAFEEAMPPGYLPRSSDERCCTFMKELSGDRVLVLVEPFSGGPPLRLRAQFTAEPW